LKQKKVIELNYSAILIFIFRRAHGSFFRFLTFGSFGQAKEQIFYFFCHFFLDEKVTKKSRKSKPNLPTGHSLPPPDFPAYPQWNHAYSINYILSYIL
jgi:hypothetical protein